MIWADSPSGTSYSVRVLNKYCIQKIDIVAVSRIYEVGEGNWVGVGWGH